MYLLADIRNDCEPMSKETSIEVWQRIFYSIQQGYTKRNFIETLQSQSAYPTESRNGLYSDDVKTLYANLQEDTHFYLLHACYKTINEIGNRDIQLLAFEENIEYIANKYKVSIKKRERPHNFTKSGNFSLNTQAIRKRYNGAIFWEDRKHILDSQWYNKIKHPINFLIEGFTLANIRREQDIKRRNQLSKARKIIIEKSWHVFLIQKKAEHYLFQYTK